MRRERRRLPRARGLRMGCLAVLLGATAWLSPSAAPAAYFERVEVGARGLALAEAYGAGVRDVSAAHWNPAALSLLERGEIIATHARPYLVENLSASALVVGLPVPFATGGAALWLHRLAVDGVVAENLLCLSYGRWAYRDHARTVHLGGTAKIAQVSFDEDAGARDFGSKTRITGDLALLWQEGASWRLGALWRNLGEPDFDFVSEGSPGGASLEGGLVLSGSYQWRPEASLHVSHSDVGNEGTWSYAAEIWFYDAFAIRGGIHDEEFSGGFGLAGRGWELDAAFLTQKSLGNTYRASLLLYLPEKQEKAR